LELIGEANDYVGKGMSGGEIIVRPPKAAQFEPAENVIIGNTVLYGATGGRMFINGVVGERFAVRNSGAVALCEASGDHTCEYMTNGTVVVLGPTGRNFGAGMTGGRAFVLDLQGNFERLYNRELIRIERLKREDDTKFLQSLIYDHLDRTESARADEVLKSWEKYRGMFWKIIPRDAPTIRRRESQGIEEAGAKKEPAQA
jgi:glutamate synthase domain-containing protein 3